MTLRPVVSMLTVANLTQPGLVHGFFGRAGGVSTGPYESLNAGLGSNDDPAAVAENRRRCAAALGAGSDRLVTAYQVHSASALAIEAPFDGARPEVDGLATRAPGLAIGVLTADCMPWLLADMDAGVIGVAHGGWRGALGGILGATVDAMSDLGAAPERIAAALGPCLRQPNFEVGMDLVDAFLSKYPDTDDLFVAGESPDKRQFDLAEFGARRLRALGVQDIEDTRRCTLGENEAFFSYRGDRRRGDADGGRNLSAIMLVA